MAASEEPPDYGEEEKKSASARSDEEENPSNNAKPPITHPGLEVPLEVWKKLISEIGDDEVNEVALSEEFSKQPGAVQKEAVSELVRSSKEYLLPVVSDEKRGSWRSISGTLHRGAGASVRWPTRKRPAPWGLSACTTAS